MKARKEEKEEMKKGREEGDASLSSIPNFFTVHCSVIKTPETPNNKTKHKIGIFEVFLNQIAISFSLCYI